MPRQLILLDDKKLQYLKKIRYDGRDLDLHMMMTFEHLYHYEEQKMLLVSFSSKKKMKIMLDGRVIRRIKDFKNEKALITYPGQDGSYLTGILELGYEVHGCRNIALKIKAHDWEM